MDHSRACIYTNIGIFGLQVTNVGSVDYQHGSVGTNMESVGTNNGSVSTNNGYNLFIYCLFIVSCQVGT